MEVILVVGITDISHSVFEISFYPNPVNNKLNLQMSFSSSETVEIVAVNSLGQETELFNRIVEKGKKEFSFETEKFPPGVYFLQITVGGGKSSYQRFVKM